MRDGAESVLILERIDDEPDIWGLETASVAEAPPGTKDRRKYTRFGCVGTAEIRSHGDDRSVYAGELSDISLGGCYVRANMGTMLTLRTGAVVQIKLVIGDELLIANGRIVTPTPSDVGVGIEFCKLDPAGARQIVRLIEQLRY
jgi:c-di-GMP-binding flagellar brake protein YcgR